MSTALMHHLRELANLRADQVAAADALKLKRAQFDAENAALIAHAKQLGDAVGTAEIQVRAIARLEYEQTSSKTPAPGVEIKIGKLYEYSSEDALAWAKQTKLCLVPESLDEKAFEKIAKATPLPFVKVKEEPKVFIATQLNASLYTEPPVPAAVGE